jgi:hypothetical protein
MLDNQDFDQMFSIVLTTPAKLHKPLVVVGAAMRTSAAAAAACCCVTLAHGHACACDRTFTLPAPRVPQVLDELLLQAAAHTRVGTSGGRSIEVCGPIQSPSPALESPEQGLRKCGQLEVRAAEIPPIPRAPFPVSCTARASCV